MIDNKPFKPVVRVIEVCHDPMERVFDFPGVRNVNRQCLRNGRELSLEIARSVWRYDRQSPEHERRAKVDLGFRLVCGDPVYLFQFEFAPRPVVKDHAGDNPLIGPKALARLTGISRHQVYRAVGCGMVDTFVLKWSVARTDIIVNDRLAFWMWAYTLPPLPLGEEQRRFRAAFASAATGTYSIRRQPTIWTKSGMPCAAATSGGEASIDQCIVARAISGSAGSPSIDNGHWPETWQQSNGTHPETRALLPGIPG